MSILINFKHALVTGDMRVLQAICHIYIRTVYSLHDITGRPFCLNSGYDANLCGLLAVNRKKSDLLYKSKKLDT